MQNLNPTLSVLVPHEIVNDNDVKIVRFLVADGTQVLPQQPLVEIETSKSLIELHSPGRGFFKALWPVGTKVAIGQAVGEVCATRLASETVSVSSSAVDSRPDVLVATEPARAVAAKHQFDLLHLAHLPLIRRADVEAYLKLEEPAVPRTLFTNHRLVTPTLNGPRVPVLIIGAGGQAAVVADILLQDDRYQLLGFVEKDDLATGTEVVGGYKTVAGGNDLEKRFNPAQVALFVAIGSNHLRLKVAQHYADLGFGFVNAIHRTASIAVGVQMGAGLAVFAQSMIGPRSRIGDHAIVNTKASIDHDGHLGRGAHLAPGCTLGGAVSIGELALIGIGCNVNLGVTIGSDVTIASGFSIYRNVPNGMSLSTKIGRQWW